MAKALRFRKSLTVVLVLGGLFLFEFTACSPSSSEKNSATAQIRFPTLDELAGKSANRAQSDDSASGSFDFTKACFAVNVTGPALATPTPGPAAQCQMPVGIFQGFVQPGQSLSVGVPYLNGLHLDVIAYLRKNATDPCPATTNSLAGLDPTALSVVGSVGSFNVTSATVNLAVTLQVPTSNLVASYNLPSTCVVSSTPTPTPVPLLGVSPTPTFATVDVYSLAPGFSSRASAVAVDAGGNIFAVGTATDQTGTPRWQVRELPAGSSTWATVDDYIGSGYAQAQAITIAPNGNILVGGFSGGESPLGVVRMSADHGVTWTVSDSFSVATISGSFNGIMGMTTDQFGHVFAVGYGYMGAWFVRMSNNPYSSWVSVDSFAGGVATAVTIDPMGNIWVAGFTGNYIEGVRESTNGGSTWLTVDTYSYGSGDFNLPRTIGSDSSGNIYVAGFEGVYSASTYYPPSDWFVRKFSPVSDQWSIVDSATSNQANGFSANSTANDTAGNIYVGGGLPAGGGNTSWTIKASSNGGSTWSVIDSPALGGSVNAITMQGTNIVASGTDGGNWVTRLYAVQPSPTPVPTAPLRKFTVEDGASGAGITTGNQAIATDSSGNFYVSGNTNHAIDGQTLHGATDFFISKYTSAGARLWTIEDGATSGTTKSMAIAVDSSGNVYVTGTTSVGIDGQTLHGSVDFFITKYNSSGSRQWTIEDGAPSNNVGSQGIAVDSSGNVVVCGYAQVSVDGATFPGGIDYFLTKYNSSGTRQWTLMDGATGSQTYAEALAVDASGNILIGGFTGTALDGQTLHGTYDLFVSKYTAAGARLWTVEDGSPNAYAQMYGIATDSLGNSYLAGTASGGGLDGQTLRGTSDLIITKYGPTGLRQWTVEDGSGGGAVSASSVAVDASGSVYVTGKTQQSLDGQMNYGTDVFLTKYNPSGVRQWTIEDGVVGGAANGSGVAIDSSGNISLMGTTSLGIDGQSLLGSLDHFISVYH